MKTRRVRIEFTSSNMAVSVAKTCTAPVLLKESDITEASDVGRKQHSWEKLIYCFGSDLSVIVKVQLVI